MQCVLITGGAGFLGSHLTRSFQEHGVGVRIFDIAPAPEWAQATPVEYVQGDIRDAGAVAAAMQGVDAVIHSAFASPRLPPHTIRGVNIDGVRTTCEQALAHRVPRMVLISSTVVNRNAHVHPIFRSAGVSALDLYRETRTEAERVATALSGRELRLAIVHPKTFVGAGRVSAFTIVFEWIRLGKPVLLMGHARARYQLLEIGDMAEGIRLLAECEAPGVFCFGAQSYGRLRDDLQALIEHAGTGSRLQFLPPMPARVALRTIELLGFVPPSELHYMSAWDRDSVVDTSKASRELGWRPRWSNIEALQHAYDWYVESIRGTGAAPAIHALPSSHRILQSVIETFLR